MPRGDGTGPAGDGSGRGSGGGRGMGRGRGQGQGRGGRRGLGAGARSQTTGPLRPPLASQSTEPETAERLRQQAVAAEQQLARAGPRGADVSDSNARLVAYVDEEACTPCGACQSVCPTEAITLGETSVRVKAEACCGCGACVDVCENGAIKLI